MKKKISILIALSLITFVGCKDDKSASQEQQQEQVLEKTANNVKVSLTATVRHDDSFQLFYKEEDNAEIPFAEQDALWNEIKGSDQPQKIEFILPENVIPNYLRLDVGTNSENNQITILNLKINYKDKELDINTVNFFEKYFLANQYISIEDKANGVFNTKKENDIYDPLFFSEENLKIELQNFFK